MNLTKRKHLADLRASIAEAAAAGMAERHKALSAIMASWKTGQSLLRFAPLLADGSDRTVQDFVAESFAYAEDERVLKLLMNAAMLPVNENYSATFLWPCGNYDCTKHLNFFVDFMMQCDDPGEAMLACVDVIEAMQGPFNPRVLKSNVRKLLGSNGVSKSHIMDTQRELFKVQAAYALLDRYFGQVDSEWKAGR